jgi:MFS family permease
MDSQQDPATSNLRFILRALRYRNYRLFFSGQIVSLTGTWLTTVASSWLVYRLATESGQSVALMLGLVGFAGQIPVFLLTPLAGVWVDRWNRHTILVVTQTLSMIQSFTLAALALAGVIDIPQLIALNLFQGFVTAWDVPARQAFTVEMVEDSDDLSNAIALSSSMVHSARLFGPALAGYLIYAFGEGYCFLIDGISYLAVIGALVAMRVRPVARPISALRALASLREGLHYAFGFRPIRTLILLVAVTSLVATSQSTLMPIFAAQVLGGQERTLGLLLGSAGLGALVGSLYLASRRTVVGLGRVIAIACATLGVGLILFSVSRSLEFSLPLLSVVGFSMVVQMASTNTVLQTIVHDDKRGRVMALYTMAFLGVAPLGSLLAGGVAALVGAPMTLTLAGAVCIVAASVFASRLPSLRPLIRPIYQRKGILPQIAEGIQSTEPISTAPRD